jgi:hypothetical protein
MRRFLQKIERDEPLLAVAIARQFCASYEKDTPARPLLSGVFFLVRLGEQWHQLCVMAVMHDERFFLRAITATDIGLGESFLDGDWTTPDLVALLLLMVRNLRVTDARNRLASVIRVFASRVRPRLRADFACKRCRSAPVDRRPWFEIGNLCGCLCSLAPRIASSKQHSGTEKGRRVKASFLSKAMGFVLKPSCGVT